MTEFLQYLIDKFPHLLAFLAIVGTLRMINKPLFMALRAIASGTPSPRDDKWLDDVEGSALYKFISFVLDYLGSIKKVK